MSLARHCDWPGRPVAEEYDWREGRSGAGRLESKEACQPQAPFGFNAGCRLCRLLVSESIRGIHLDVDTHWCLSVLGAANLQSMTAIKSDQEEHLCIGWPSIMEDRELVIKKWTSE